MELDLIGLLREYYDILSLILQLFILMIAYFALSQINEMRKQNKLTSETTAINELRKFEELLADYELVIDSIKGKTKLRPIEMDDFNLKESSSEKYKDNMRYWNDFYKNNKILYSDVVRCANKLEILATSLEKGTASIETIQDPIMVPFCSIVENIAYVYVKNRNSVINLFKNTITLYNKFKPIVGKIDENIEKINKEVEEILNKKL